MKKSRITLTWKTFIYFVVFAGLIVSSFWLLEIYFLEGMYAKSKKENCYDVAMQVVAVGFIIGVVQDSVETALNSSGDAFFTIATDMRERLKRGEKIDIV